MNFRKLSLIVFGKPKCLKIIKFAGIWFNLLTIAVNLMATLLSYNLQAPCVFPFVLRGLDQTNSNFFIITLKENYLLLIFKIGAQSSHGISSSIGELNRYSRPLNIDKHLHHPLPLIVGYAFVMTTYQTVSFHMNTKFHR